MKRFFWPVTGLFLIGFAVIVSGTFRVMALYTSPTSDTLTGALIAQLQEENATSRARAALALAGVTDRRAREMLLKELLNEDHTVAYRVVSALSANADSATVTSLLAELENEDPMVRARATMALARMDRDPPLEAIPALAAALHDAATARWAGEALAGMPHHAAHDVLLEALADSRLTTRRQAAMRAIEEVAPRPVAELIIDRAMKSGDPVLRRNAIALRDLLYGDGR